MICLTPIQSPYAPADKFKANTTTPIPCLQVNPLAQQGDEEGARRNAKYAKRWGAAAIGFSGFILVIGVPAGYFITFFAVGISSSSS